LKEIEREEEREARGRRRKSSKRFLKKQFHRHWEIWKRG